MGFRIEAPIRIAATVAPKVGGIRPSLGTISGFPAPKMEFSVGRIVNPFLGIPKASSYIENKASSLPGPKEVQPRIDSRVFPVLEAVKKPAVLERKTAVWVGTPRRPDIVPVPEIKPAFAMKVEPGIQVVPQFATEGRPATRLVRTTSASVRPQAQVEEIIEKKQAAAEDQKTQKPEVKRSEKTSQLRVKLVEAVKVSERRREVLRVAWERAVQTGEKLTLRLIRKFLVWSKEDLSPIVRDKGVDGTIKLTNEALESDTTGYSSQEAKERAVSLVEEYKPVEEGEGHPVTIEEVRQVLEGKEAEVTRVATAAEIVKKRVTRLSEVVKGGVVVYSSEEKVETEETSLKDFPVVFRESLLPKAA